MFVFEEEGVDESGVEFAASGVAGLLVGGGAVAHEVEGVVEFGEQFFSGAGDDVEGAVGCGAFFLDAGLFGSEPLGFDGVVVEQLQQLLLLTIELHKLLTLGFALSCMGRDGFVAADFELPFEFIEPFGCDFDALPGFEDRSIDVVGGYVFLCAFGGGFGGAAQAVPVVVVLAVV